MNDQQIEQADVIMKYIFDNPKNEYTWRNLSTHLGIPKNELNSVLDVLKEEGWVRRTSENNISIGHRRGIYSEWIKGVNAINVSKEISEVKNLSGIRGFKTNHPIAYDTILLLAGALLGYFVTLFTSCP